MDERETCFHCGEQALRAARLCPHCRQSLLVDVRLPGAVRDGRRRYQLARSLSALGPPMPGFSELQQTLQAERPLVAAGVTRELAARAVELAAPLDVRIEPSGPARGPAGTRVALAAAATLGVIAVGLAALLLPSLLRRALERVRPAESVRPASASATPRAGRALTPREIAARTLPALASLRCSDSVGAGFFVADELLLTNAHVLCREGEAVSVALSGGRTLPGGVVRRDEALDLALVRVPGASAPALPLGDAGELALGDRVLAAGSPVGLEFSVSEGLVSNLDQVLFGAAYIQTDARINPGNSGGPLLDTRGRVVGIVSLKHSQAEGVAWALPINYAYTGAEAFVEPPGAGPSTPGWEAMLARAEAVNRETRTQIHAADLRPALVGARVDQYQRLVARILHPARTDPGYTDVKVKLRSGDEVFCTLGGSVSEWKLVQRATTGDDAERRYWSWLESNGLDARLYLGEAAMSWSFCPHDRMLARGVVLELVDGNPQASQLRLR